jgi:hypothetical protein
VQPEPTALDLELVTASLRADASDLRAFVEGLAVKLEAVLPAGVRIERRRSGLRGPKSVRAIVVEAGDRRFELESDAGLVRTWCSRLSGGIVLKRESLDSEAWLAALGEALAAEARRNQTTRQALERLLIQ